MKKKTSELVVVPVPVAKPWLRKSAAVIAQAQEKMQKAEEVSNGMVQG
jgi:hypothetical protein